MKHTDTKHVRRAKKAALFLKEISELFYQAAQDNPDLKDIYPGRITFSADLGICYLFFFSPHGREFFESKKKFLILFKPSLRTAIASRIPMRRIPDFVFLYDDEYEKEQKIDTLISKLKDEGKF